MMQCTSDLTTADGEQFERNSTFVSDEHPAVRQHPSCFAPAPDHRPEQSVRTAGKADDRFFKGAPPASLPVEEELRRRDDALADMADDDLEARFSPEAQAERRFWKSTDALLERERKREQQKLDRSLGIDGSFDGAEIVAEIDANRRQRESEELELLWHGRMP